MDRAAKQKATKLVARAERGVVLAFAKAAARGRLEPSRDAASNAEMAEKILASKLSLVAAARDKADMWRTAILAEHTGGRNSVIGLRMSFHGSDAILEKKTLKEVADASYSARRELKALAREVELQRGSGKTALVARLAAATAGESEDLSRAAAFSAGLLLDSLALGARCEISMLPFHRSEVFFASSAPMLQVASIEELELEAAASGWDRCLAT